MDEVFKTLYRWHFHIFNADLFNTMTLDINSAYEIMKRFKI